VQIFIDFFLYKKDFPIVQINISSREDEDYLNAYYRYGLNNFFGAYPINIKTSIEPIFFFIINLSKTLSDFSISFDYIYDYYFTDKVTKNVVKSTREYFYSILINNNSQSTDPFIEYPDLWYKLGIALKVYYIEVSKELSNTYFNFMYSKINRLYVTALESVKCNSDDENIVRNFLDKIRKKFNDSISSSKNSELRNLLLNMPFTSLNIQGLNTLESNESFYDVYNFSERSATIVPYNLGELREEFDKSVSYIISTIYNNIFSDNSIYVQEISRVKNNNNEEIGIDIAKGLVNFIK
jgi:hypothetical protein